MTSRYLNKLLLHWERVEGEPYFASIPAIRSLKELNFPSNVTFFVGENGTGKSTLLEAIAVEYGFNPEGGSRNFNFTTRDSHSDLYRCISFHKGPVRPKDGFFLRAESFYNLASQVDEYASVPARGNFYQNYGGKSLHQQSHGESFFSLLKNRFWGNGLYLLDEPESALSPQRQLAVLALLYHLGQEGSQLIIATHSPILLGLPEAAIYSFDGEAVHPVSYEETESYQVTKMFLTRREQMLEELLRQ